MKTCLLILSALCLCGCATTGTDGSSPTPFALRVPLPPSGEKAGQLGYLVFGYEPNLLGTANYFLNRQPSTKGYSK